MRVVALACSAVLVTASVALAQSAAPTSLTAEAARADFDVLRRSLEEAHGGFDRFSSRADLARRFDAHRRRINGSMSTPAFAGIVAEAIAEIRDGHARLEFDSLTNAALADARVFPLRVQLDDRRLMVLFNDSPVDSSIRPGMEIVRINGRAVDDLIGSLLPKISGDGFIETGKRRHVGRQFAQLYWLYVERAENFNVTARDSRGRSISATLPGILERDRRTIVNPVNAVIAGNMARIGGTSDNISLQLLDSTVARLRIRSFGGQSFVSTLDSAFDVLREKQTRALILDLRGNGGGVDEYGALLVSHFVDRPFRYFDRIHLTSIAPSFATWPPHTFTQMRDGTVPDPKGGFLVTRTLHSGVGEQQPARNAFAGKLIALIDGGSFSTTADVAAQLRSLGRATFVGEETPGTYEGNTSGLNAMVILPNSRLRLKIMMYGYWNAVRAPDKPGRGTLPDHTVTLRVADLLNGVDTPLQRAIALARQ